MKLFKKKKYIVRTEYVRTKHSLSGGITYAYKYSLGQKICRGILSTLAILLLGGILFQVVVAVINLF